MGKEVAKREKGGALQVWKPMDLSDLADFDADIQASGNNEFVKLKEGTNKLRLLPAMPGQKLPFIKVMEHFLEDLPGQKGKTFKFVCPRSMSKGKMRCPACAHSDQLKSTGNPLDNDTAFQWSARLQIYANVIDRKREEDGPKVFAFGKKIWNQLKPILEDKHDGGDASNPGEDGFDIIVVRKGTKKDTDYSVRTARKNSSLTDDPDVLETWLEGRKNLEKYKTLPDPEELKAALRGESRRGRSDDDDEEDEEDEKPRKKMKSANTKALSSGKFQRRRSAQDDLEKTIDVEGSEVDDDEDDGEPPL